MNLKKGCLNLNIFKSIVGIWALLIALTFLLFLYNLKIYKLLLSFNVMNKKRIYILVIMFALLFTFLFVLKVIVPSISGKAVATNSNGQAITITKENFAPVFEQQEFITGLPKNALISFRFYNFDSGERQWEESYSIRKGKIVQENVENSDLDIILHSKYLPYLGQGFCSVIQYAKENGDIAFDTKISLIKFMWKYRSMMKYKDCFGF